MQRLEREGRVADPRVAVVPVPLAARRLRERGRQRGDRRAGRHVGQALDRQRRPLHRVAQPVIRDPRTAQPSAPEARRRVDAAPRPRRSFCGAASSSAHDRAQYARSPACSTWRPRTESPSMPSARSDTSRNVTPAPVASAACAAPSTERPLRRRHGRSRRRARRRARSRRGRRGTRPCARACGRRRRRPEAACAA